MRKSQPKSSLRLCSPRTRLRVAIICIRFALRLTTEKHFLPLLPKEFHRIRSSYFAHSPITTIEGIVELLREAGVGCTFGECHDILTKHTTYRPHAILQWRAAERVAMALKHTAYRNRRGGSGGVDEDVQVVFSALDEEGTGRIASDRVRNMLVSFELSPGISLLPITAFQHEVDGVGRMGRRSTFAPAEEMLNVAEFAQRFIQIDSNVEGHHGRNRQSSHRSSEEDASIAESVDMDDMEDRSPKLMVSNSSSSPHPLMSAAWGSSMRQQGSMLFTDGQQLQSSTSQVFDGFRATAPSGAPSETPTPFQAQSITSLLERRVQEWSRDCPKPFQRRVPPLSTPKDQTLAEGELHDAMSFNTSARGLVSPRLYDVNKVRSGLPPVSPRGKSRPAVIGFCSSSQRFEELKPLPKPSTRVDIPRHQVTLQSTPRRAPQPPETSKQYDLRRTDARLIGFGPTSYY
ncbi:Hypothetical protein, putative [Bodo saltans]|uniref:EF-hand domain-containing protein n=1 Tax=Bodo saltans TaxID=75058 RepID=A0A0S4IYJ1_BODSA|nr:Hypothetical protein, putative [Bodo saltans]|eukprot:CUG55371.1 Hypothetical protein, putative [Bodo saltans]